MNEILIDFHHQEIDDPQALRELSHREILKIQDHLHELYDNQTETKLKILVILEHEEVIILAGQIIPSVITGILIDHIILEVVVLQLEVVVPLEVEVVQIKIT